MITRQQALTASEFHEDHEPAGKIFTWRRNGATQTWKTRPDDFRVPVKYGLRNYGQIHEYNAGQFHVAEECPTRHVRVTLPDGGECSGIVTGEPVPDRAGYGVTTVHVTTRGTTKHRVGSEIRTATKYVTYL